MLNRNKPSVTEILSDMYPMPKGVFEEALSFEKLSIKHEKGELIKWWVAHQAMELHVPDVMNMLTTVGTLVHSVAYDIGTLWLSPYHKDTAATPFINSLLAFFDTYWAYAIHAEASFECEEYRWTTDGIYCIIDPKTHEEEYVILDWKTWGAYKYLYGIDMGKPLVKSSDKKKVSVQLSMYQKMFDPQFEWIYHYRGKTYPIAKRIAVWIRPDGYQVIDCKNEYSLYEEWKNVKSNTSLTLSVWKRL